MRLDLKIISGSSSLGDLMPLCDLDNFRELRTNRISQDLNDPFILSGLSCFEFEFPKCLSKEVVSTMTRFFLFSLSSVETLKVDLSREVLIFDENCTNGHLSRFSFVKFFGAVLRKHRFLKLISIREVNRIIWKKRAIKILCNLICEHAAPGFRFISTNK